MPLLPPVQHLRGRRIFFRALIILALCLTFLIICILDVPKSIYFCPIFNEDYGLSSSSYSPGQQFIAPDENCYWSTSYVEAREKFVALGNRLKAQTRRERERTNGGGEKQQIIDVRSISYNIVQPSHHDSNHEGKHKIVAGDIIKAAKEFDLFTPQTITPGSNTVDAILITLKLSSIEFSAGHVDDDESIVTNTNDESIRRSRETINIIHSSGVHGIEGYLGSAIQNRFLHQLLLLQSRNVHSTSSAAAEAGEAPISRSSDKVRKILLIHSVNPYGMQHHRRTNENNVDLNRNVLSEAAWKEVRSRHPNTYRYVDMDNMLNPFQSYNMDDGQPFSWTDAARIGGYEGDNTDLTRHDEAQGQILNSQQYQSHQDGENNIMIELAPSKSNKDMLASLLLEKKLLLRTLMSAFVAICTLGYTGAKRGIVSAQYHKPSGLSYGGGAHNNNAWENSVLAVQHAIQEFGAFSFSSSSSISASSDSSSILCEGDRTLWIDVHTGLGKYGEYSILTTKDGVAASVPVEDHSSSCPSPNNSWMTKFTFLLNEQNIGNGQSSDSASVSEGYEQTQGFMNDSILCPPPYCNSVTQEFGTRSSIGVIVALVLENMAYHTPGDEGKSYGHFLTWAFNPQRLSWRQKALRGGMEMLHAALKF